MKKILIWIWAFLSILIILGTWFFLFKNKESKLGDNKIISEELEKIDENKVDKWLSKEDNFDVLKKRFSLRWTIMKWDSYLTNNQTLLALNEYQKAYKESPNDVEIIKKIAWVYFELKKFSKAHEYYNKALNSLNNEQKENLLLSIIYSSDLEKKTNIKEASTEIKNLDISKDEKVYYINSLSCTLNFHECKKIFQDYSKSNSWTTFTKFQTIKTALDNFDNFQTENLYYKDALIIWALFQDKMYNVSNYLWEKMLIDYPNYKPILLVVWKWYYELWNIQKAKEFLTQYYNLDQSNLNVTYLLWDINFRLRDYISSNIYYNNALQNWFSTKIDLQRKLIYNYYLLKDKRWMLKMFSYLLDENDSTINDFSLWIYHAVLNWRKDEAIKWSNNWIKKFQNKTWYEVFYWYLWWIERENNNLEKAEEYITEWLKINTRNPLLTLNYWYLEEAKQNFTKALIYFKRTQNLNWEWEFWELASKETKLIEDFLQKQNTNSWNVNK